MEIRGQPLKRTYLFTLGTPVLVDTILKWNELWPQHSARDYTPIQEEDLALPIIELKLYPRFHPYKHTRGEQGIVIYKNPP